MIKISLPKLMLLSSCSFICLQALAGGPEVIAPGFWPYMPGATATALSGQLLTGFADSMIPVYGTPNEFFYIDPQGQINNSDQYAVSIGAGVRYLLQDTGILGAYVFGDYNHSLNNNSFWFLSPGVEWLGDVFDVTGNLYVPVGTQSEQIGDAVFGQDIGIFDNVAFAGHTEYDMLYNRTETDGFGGDIDVAYRIPLNPFNPKIHLGGYFSNPKDADNRAGGAIRLEFPFSKNLSVLVGDSYDNIAHNTVRAGASYSFGGRHTSYNYKHDLESRMVDPIQRNLIANSSDIHNSQPIAENALSTDEISVYLTNISFFVPEPSALSSGLLNAVLGDGTYENPYQGVTQDNVDDANTKWNRNFFVQSGTYGDPTTGMSFIELTDDNMMGRESYNGNPFVKQAEGTSRPQFFFSGSGFDITGSNSFSSLYMTAPQFHSGVGINQNHTSSLGETTIVDNMDISGFFLGIQAANSPGAGRISLLVNDSNISSNTNNGIRFRNDGGSGATGMNLTVTHSQLNNDFTGINAVNDSDAAMNVQVSGSVVANNNFTGMHITTGDLGNVNLTITNSQLNQNQIALYVEATSPAAVSITAANSSFSNSFNGPGLYFSADQGSITAAFSHSSINNNFDDGIFITNFASGSVNMSITDGSTILGNGLRAMDVSNDSPGGVNVTVDNRIGSPTLVTGEVVASASVPSAIVNFINQDGTGTVTVQSSSGTTSENVFCDSSGFCTTL